MDNYYIHCGLSHYNNIVSFYICFEPQDLLACHKLASRVKSQVNESDPTTRINKSENSMMIKVFHLCRANCILTFSDSLLPLLWRENKIGPIQVT